MALQKCFLNALLLFFFFQFGTSIDTITSTEPIKDGEILVSSGEHFALGFFSPGKSTNRYVGIWYNKVPEQTVVWVANREKPINNNSTGVLVINRDGNLVLLEGNQSNSFWSTNVSNIFNKTTATLLDSGNLVLTEDFSKRVLWQSFDYPAHTFLPGMKLGLDRKTALNRYLTSWKSDEDPGQGDFSFGIDPSGFPQFFLYNGTGTGRTRLWRSGPWNGHGLSGVPEMTKTFIFDYQFVNNENEVYMIYTIYNSSIYSRFLLDSSGTVQRLTWLDSNRRWNGFWSAPRDRCDNYGYCGGYGSCNSDNNDLCACLPGFKPKSTRDWYLRDESDGCVRERGLKCGEGEGFLKLVHLKVPDTSVAQVDTNLSLTECESKCLRNCSCSGYASEDTNLSGSGSGCVSWYGDLMDIREYTNGGQDVYIRVDSIELAAYARRNSKGVLGKKWKVVIPLVAAVLGLLILLSCGYFLKKKRKKRASMEKERRDLLLHDFGGGSKSSKNSPGLNQFDELPFFDLSVVATATNNFSTANLLGQGGFGPVYKGRLFNGQEIAVKRLSKTSGQGIEEFKNEVMLIAKLQHRNLVRLLGCCVQEEEKTLIYEYMPNKSLDLFIFDDSKRAMLDWRKRFEIIIGIARGILYLHQDSRLRIVHRDLKTSNILLDGEMNPKISDFGMARIFGRKQMQANTNRVVGTYGYMSPEYAMDGLFSTKSDVFSFGVLLLEIISGKKNTSFYHEDPDSNLIGHVWELWKEGKGLEIVDSTMTDSYPVDEVLRCLQVGLLCVQGSASDRPNMSNVVFMLGNETTMPSPKLPAFFMKQIFRDPDSSTSGTGSCSINEVTITMVDAR